MTKEREPFQVSLAGHIHVPRSFPYRSVQAVCDRRLAKSGIRTGAFGRYLRANTKKAQSA